MTVRVGAPIADPTPLEHFLTARWGLHTRAYGRTLHLPNWHPQWPLHRAELLHLDDELVTAAGLPPPAGPPVSVLHSPGIPVVFGGRPMSAEGPNPYYVDVDNVEASREITVALGFTVFTQLAL